MHRKFPANLRRLVRSYPSTSRAAEALGLNRQQLNKYLNGLNMPSLATLRSIAAHFDLEPDDLLLPVDRFAARWHPPMRIEGLPPRMQQAFAALLENMAQTRGALSRSCGCYQVCTPLRSNPDRIGRAYTVISQEGDLTLVKTIMYATSRGGRPGSRQPIKIDGFAQWLGGRIYITDVQNVGRPNARLRSIALFPPALPSMPFLTGLLMTTNNALTRPIYSTPIVFKRLPGRIPQKRDLAACGVFYRDDPRLDPAVMALLDAGASPR
jgi:transcriptional regulator with XRE-family HTH domain